MHGELRLALPDEYATSPPAPKPIAEPAPTAPPDLSLAPIDGSASAALDHARHEYQDALHEEALHHIEVVAPPGSLPPPSVPEPEPPPPPRPWIHRDVAEIARIDVGEAIRKAIPARPVIKVAPDELARLVAQSEHGTGPYTLAGVALANDSECAGFAIINGTESQQSALLDSLIAQAQGPHRRLLVANRHSALWQRYGSACEAAARIESYDSLNTRLTALGDGGTLCLPIAHGTAALVGDALAERMPAHAPAERSAAESAAKRMAARAVPLWIVIQNIERLDPIPGLQRAMAYGWTRGIVLAFTVSDWQRFEALYGSHGAVQLIGERQHKLILRTPDIRASRWASDLLNGVPAAEIRALAEHRAFFRHAGAYPATEIAVSVPLLEAA